MTIKPSDKSLKQGRNRSWQAVPHPHPSTPQAETIEYQRTRQVSTRRMGKTRKINYKQFGELDEMEKE